MSAATIKLGLLLLAFLPLLIDNIRTGQAKNALVGAMLALGVLAAFFGPSFGADPLKLSTLIGWILAAACLFGLAAAGVVPAGIAKFLIALLPWFPFKDYLLTVTIGMMLAALIGWATKKNALIVPPMMIAALAVGLMPVLGFKPF